MAKADYIRRQFCCVPNCANRIIQAAHVRSRGAGGGDDQLVPLCWQHHEEQHRIGIKTFQTRHGIDLHELAKHYDDLYAGRKTEF